MKPEAMRVWGTVVTVMVVSGAVLVVGFINGGYIQFDVKYPVGVNVVTYFEQASAHLY